MVCDTHFNSILLNYTGIPLLLTIKLAKNMMIVKIVVFSNKIIGLELKVAYFLVSQSILNLEIY